MDDLRIYMDNYDADLSRILTGLNRLNIKYDLSLIKDVCSYYTSQELTTYFSTIGVTFEGDVMYSIEVSSQSQNDSSEWTKIRFTTLINYLILNMVDKSKEDILIA